jgi:hypothetical protein
MAGFVTHGLTPIREKARGAGAFLPKETPGMCFALLARLVLLYLFSSKPGWFACLLVLLVVGILVAGCR